MGIRLAHITTYSAWKQIWLLTARAVMGCVNMLKKIYESVCKINEKKASPDKFFNNKV